MSKKKNLVQKITNWKIIVAIQIIASLIFIGLLFKLGALPMKYAIVVIVLIALLCLGTFFLMKPSKISNKGKIRNIIGKFVSVLLSLLLLMGSLYVAQGDSVINKITGAKGQVNRFSVMVKKDSSYEKLSDLKNETIELNSSVDTEKMNKAIEALKKEESSIQTVEKDDFAKMADDLYDGTVKAIFVNEAYYAILETNHENFETETKVIWTYEIDEEVNDISKNVNVTKNVFTIYISGIDTTGPVSTVSRSDVNMLVTVNPKTKQILMTSIPRDYYVTLADRGQKDKLTHAGISGVENSVKTIEGLMGIDINYYARVNFTSLITMVDALGGIDVYSDLTFSPWTNPNITIHEGMNHMDGKTALAFSRERKAYASGDNHRVQNQQEVLKAMLNKMMSPAIITNYSKVLNSIAGCFETNMSSSEITSLLQMQINDMASWDIMQIQLSGHGTTMTGGAMIPNTPLYYMLPDDESVSRCSSLIKQMANGEKISVE